MSNAFPPQLDRKNSDPEPYAPLLGNAAPPDASMSQYQYAAQQPGYYDRPPASAQGTPDYRDPYYGESGRYDDRPYGAEGFSDGRPGGGRDQPDPFARSPSREAREREREQERERVGSADPYAQPHDPYNPYGPNQYGGGGGDIELRPMDSQKTNRFMPPPSALNTMDTILFATGVDRICRLIGIKMGESNEQVVQRRRRGMPGQRWPVMAYLLTAIMCAIMVYELIANQKAQGTPISTKPTFNFMIGPSSTVLINIGARFAPCMRAVPGIPATLSMGCPSNTANPPTEMCTIEQICGHGGFGGGTPDQSWRLFSPIFLHVGIIHLLVNMFAQITMSGPMERMMGSIPWLIVYIAGGIYGNLLGGSFSLAGIPSAGASGAIFAIEACAMVDLALHWKYEPRPRFKAMMFGLEFLLIVAMGYIPFAVDGLAHLGGFAMGLLLGVVLVPSTPETKRYRMIVWGCRLVALPLAILAFALTTKNFYSEDPNAACTWCRYLSCIPTSSNNQCKGTGLTMTNTTSN